MRLITFRVSSPSSGPAMGIAETVIRYYHWTDWFRKILMQCIHYSCYPLCNWLRNQYQCYMVRQHPKKVLHIFSPLRGLSNIECQLDFMYQNRDLRIFKEEEYIGVKRVKITHYYYYSNSVVEQITYMPAVTITEYIQGEYSHMHQWFDGEDWIQGPMPTALRQKFFVSKIYRIIGFIICVSFAGWIGLG